MKAKSYIDIVPLDPELKCPKCNSDMKEYVTSFKCRNLDCRFEYTKQYILDDETRRLLNA